MKKLIALLLALVMVLGLVACASKTTDETPRPTIPPPLRLTRKPPTTRRSPPTRKPPTLPKRRPVKSAPTTSAMPRT